MLKKINWRAILVSFLWLVSLGGLITLMSFIEIKKSDLKCKDVKVLLPGQYNFIERDEVDHILMENAGAMVGMDLNDINIHKLENALRANPFIEFAKVYVDMTGVIHVQIRQRKPVLRVVNMANIHFYIDGNGNKIPLSDNYTAKVLVASGLIEEDFNGRVDTLQTKMARDLFRTALFIRSDTLWDNQIEQLYVDLKGDIEMVPRVGGHKIILGSADSIETKFRNLLVFYKKAIPKVGWDTYKTINLKYANQIVCEKNIIDTTRLTLDISKQVVDSTITETQN
ncbi:MAG: cell division protein FtsQ [Daejeonella sp.]|uniref:cell division protein FtsQ/DivIB n=1 Tax=Daejeonella sp. TaxID=2805397 RepID=UPI0027339CF4|nr:cell division protein FtsQ [Daejeonella sp.]MDP3468852.1 cell division protein FtsQ [Daejeonella sp.]